MGLKWVKISLMVGLWGGITGCSGDRTTQSWFAPDPQLTGVSSPAESTPPKEQENPTTPKAISPRAILAEKDLLLEGTGTTLPRNFPNSIPRYPQSELVRSQYQPSQVQGQTDWETSDSPQEILDFYQEALPEKDWNVTENREQKTLTATQGDIQLEITFPEKENSDNLTQFVLAYSNQNNTKPSEKAQEQTLDLSNVPAQVREYIEDLAALGAIPDDFQPNQAINRRTFARWLFETHNYFYRDRPTKQIRPASDKVQPAFSDIPPSDPDFAIIQGLAQAGIIPSRLTVDDSALLFQPDSPLTREQLILWKVPLDIRKSLPDASLDTLEQTWGFQDIAQINPNIFPALLADFENGDKANVLRAFGYTTLFQPKQPVTGAEAAAALWYFGNLGEGISALDAQELSD